MELDFSVASSNEMVHNMRRGTVAFGAAEPFVAGQAFDNAARRMDTAVTVVMVSYRMCAMSIGIAYAQACGGNGSS
jgi:hypothetical protein